jgi:precorrin-2 dehydrogenase/sirohydrochlorin ferrochelatase
VKHYPVFLNIKDKEVVVIGGGKVAERKVRTLCKAGAKVKIVSPKITAYLKKLKKTGRLKHIDRSYRKGDLKNAFIVIACTPSEEINKKIARDAPNLVNVTDTPSAGNFIVPSVVKRGHLTIAISTGGISPAAAKTIRKELEKLYGEEFARYLRLLEKIRKKALKQIPDKKLREKFLKEIASGKIFKALRSKNTEQVFVRINNEFLKNV